MKLRRSLKSVALLLFAMTLFYFIAFKEAVISKAPQPQSEFSLILALCCFHWVAVKQEIWKYLYSSFWLTRASNLNLPGCKPGVGIAGDAAALLCLL